MKFLLHSSILIVLALLSLSLGVTSAKAATLTVCPTGIAGQNGCDYIGGDSIQAAVDAAASGDTILLRAGTYTRMGYSNYDDPEGKPRKSFVFIPQTPTRTLTLQGEGTATLDGANSIHALTGIVLQGGATTVKNLTIRGMKLERDGDVCVEDNQICGKGTGIYMDKTAQATIANNIIKGNQNVGIHLNESATATLANNTIYENEVGIALVRSTQATIQGNQITGNNGVGIALRENSQATITNNSVTNNATYGIYCFEISACTLLNNIVVANKNVGIIGRNASNIKHFRYNLSWNNTNGNFNDFFSSSQLSSWGNISQDPRFISATDFHLQPGSPAINAGDPNIKDVNGSRSDIGAYGGPTNGQPLILNASFEWSTFDGSYEVSSGMNPNETAVIDGQQWPAANDGRYYAKLGRGTGDAYVATEWIETGTDVTGKAFTVTFDVKSHNAETPVGNLTLQRHPLDGDWSDTGAYTGIITATTNWTTKTATLTFNRPRNGNTSSRVRIVLRPTHENAPYIQPIYYDNIKLESVAIITPTSTPIPLTPTPTQLNLPTSTPIPPTLTPKPPLASDYNGDGKVNLADLSFVKNQIGQGMLNIFDYNKVIQVLAR